MQQEILGVDIGGVIVDRANNTMDTSFFRSRYLESTAVPGAFEAIARLTHERFHGEVHIVSKCGPQTEERSRHWLLHHRFNERTGIGMERVHFCRERQEKAPICERLGVTHFIDDKLEVLGYLESVPHRFLFNPIEKEVQKFSRHLPLVTRVQNWKELLKVLLK